MARPLPDGSSSHPPATPFIPGSLASSSSDSQSMTPPQGPYTSLSLQFFALDLPTTAFLMLSSGLCSLASTPPQGVLHSHLVPLPPEHFLCHCHLYYFFYGDVPEVILLVCLLGDCICPPSLEYTPHEGRGVIHWFCCRTPSASTCA